MNSQRIVVAGSIVLGLAMGMSSLGCSATADAGTIAIAGTVTVDDKPISQASVAFIGNEGARLASALTDAAGKFEVRVAAGKNIVTVAKAPPGGPPPADDSEPQLMPSEGEYFAMQKAAVASEVPAKYGDPATSGLSFDITEGMKSVDVALSGK